MVAAGAWSVLPLGALPHLHGLVRLPLMKARLLARSRACLALCILFGLEARRVLQAVLDAHDRRLVHLSLCVGAHLVLSSRVGPNKVL